MALVKTNHSDTQILVHRWGPRIGILVCFTDGLNKLEFSLVCAAGYYFFDVQGFILMLTHSLMQVLRPWASAKL